MRQATPEADYVQLSDPPTSAERPRYGYGRPSHWLLKEAIALHDPVYAEHVYAFTLDPRGRSFWMMVDRI